MYPRRNLCAANYKPKWIFVGSKVGIEKLREEQGKVIRSFVGGKNVPFAALSTAYSKSLCFALLPYIFDTMKN